MDTFAYKRSLLVALCLFTSVCYSYAEDATGAGSSKYYRFEYKYSFKGPHLIQPDLTIPFWSLLGDTVAGDEQVRLVPSIRDKKGLAWSNYPFSHKAWEIEAHIRIEGRGKVGADGMAIWYISTPAEIGPVYGSRDYWNGVGIFLDSFDNDNNMDNPLISVVVNDGTKQYQHASDGIDQYAGSCKVDFRNRPYPVKVRVKYSAATLTVSYSSGNLENEDFEICTVIKDLDLPVNYYFGASAATGGLADDHDILKFLTWSINDTPAEDETVDMHEEERKKLQDNYEKNLEDFNRMQEEYRKQHPSTVQEQTRPEELYEGGASHELRSIFEIQNSIKKDIRWLSDNLNRMLGQQRLALDKLDSLDDHLKTDRTGEDKLPAGADDSAKKYHIDNLLNMQRESYDAIKQVRDSLGNLEGVVNAVQLNLQQGGNRPGGAGVDFYEQIKHIQTLADQLHGLQNDVTALLRQQSSAPKLVCPEPEMPSCVSLGVLISIAAAQVIILLIYHSMRASREDAAKKFF